MTTNQAGRPNPTPGRPCRRQVTDSVTDLGGRQYGIGIDRTCSASYCPFGGKFDPITMVVTEDPLKDPPGTAQKIADGSRDAVDERQGERCDALRK